MKKLNQVRILRALCAASGLLIGAISLNAQDGPPPANLDPAQMRQRMLDRIHEAMDIKDDSEWQVISERIAKVMDARRALRGPGGMGGFGPPGGPPPGGAPPPGNVSGSGEEGAGPGGAGEFRGPPPGGGGPGGFGGQESPEAEALRKAISAKASSAELKTKLAEFRAARVKKQAELEKAQEELRQILSVQQDAVAVTFGLL
jgi:hypothetical protein